MKCVVIQESWVPHEDAVYDRTGNILATDGRRQPYCPRWVRHWHPQELGGRDTVREGRRRQALSDSCRRLGAQIWRAWLCRLRRGGARPGETDGGIPSHVAPETPGSIHEGGETLYEITPGPAGVAVIGIIL